MAQLLVRKLDDDTKTRLQRRAARHGVSMEEEARNIIRSAVFRDEEKDLGLGSQIAALFQHIEENDDPLPEMPDQPIRPARFDE